MHLQTHPRRCGALRFSAETDIQICHLSYVQRHICFDVANRRLDDMIAGVLGKLMYDMVTDFSLLKTFKLNKLWVEKLIRCWGHTANF